MIKDKDTTVFGFGIKKVELSRFRNYCRANQLNMSAVMKRLLREWLNSKEE